MAKQEAGGGYMDNVRVKISEKYKPPPRINLAMSYAQRLTLNKQIQDTIPQYEFLLEKTVIEKMKEWRTARSAMFQELHSRLEKAKAERLKQLEDQKKADGEEVEVAYSSPNQPYQQDLLMPTQASFSNILTPIPLSQSYEFKSPEKSPFNISDFEADTSSPFDNMELKSINDLEELAQVLKSESKPSYTPSSSSLGYPIMGASSFNYTIPSTSSYIQPVSSLYSSANGYYYPPETITSNPSYYSYPGQAENKFACTTIPDIMKTLQTELDNTHLDNTRNKSSEVVPKVKTKVDDDEFSSLPKNMQELSRSISSMGFPLSRVARVCKILGNDQKKVVEHLLAMSELLDLGFPESSVSKALLQCDNDRDKALDILIS